MYWSSRHWWWTRGSRGCEAFVVDTVETIHKTIIQLDMIL
uniref:Uncharacterized protein n=1 Tax=Aegilops tauschii subsp. strangulata TaxID=200361 RepID=A0A453N2X9_AEGTS